MGLFAKIQNYFVVRRAWHAGQAASRRHLEHLAAEWLRIRPTLNSFVHSPPKAQAFFFGWMSTFYQQEREFWAPLKLSPEEFDQQWDLVCRHYIDRYEAEICGPLWHHSDTAHLTDTEVEQMAIDMPAFVAEFIRSHSEAQERSLDVAVAAVRQAEREGKLEPDPRADSELRESIREKWEEQNK